MNNLRGIRRVSFLFSTAVEENCRGSLAFQIGFFFCLVNNIYHICGANFSSRFIIFRIICTLIAS